MHKHYLKNIYEKIYALDNKSFNKIINKIIMNDASITTPVFLSHDKYKCKTLSFFK